MRPVLRVENLRVEATLADGRRAPIVRDVSFAIHPGEVLALIGESGAGKTTIALATLGYARPGCRFTAGRVFLDDIDLFGLDRVGLCNIRGRRVAYVAQSAAAAFNPALTIGEQVAECAVLHRMLARTAASARAIELYRRLDLPEPERLGRRYPHQVSGGQLQRLMVAMALLADPDLLVLDEPTTALDVTTQIEVLGALREITHRQGTAAVYVTHDIAVVSQIADRIAVLRAGELLETGDTDEIIAHPTHDYTSRLMAAVRPPPAACESTAPRERTNEDASPPALAVVDVSASYRPVIGGRPALRVLRDVDFEVRKGSVVAVIGESGCGKSTLARVIAGLLSPSDGKIVLEGRTLAKRVAERGLDDLRRAQIVFQMADVALNPCQTIAEILGRPLELYFGKKGVERDESVADLLAMVELPADLATRYPDELSGGQKQRVNLARALAAGPDVILCDEVISSLDAVVGAAVLGLLGNLREKLGIAYLFISHDLSTVASFADRIIVLYAGQVVEDGDARDVLSPPYHPYTRLLLSSVPALERGWLDDVLRTRTVTAAMTRTTDLNEIGCPFHRRCPLMIEGVCDTAPPPHRLPAAGHRIACHRQLEELGGAGPHS